MQLQSHLSYSSHSFNNPYSSAQESKQTQAQTKEKDLQTEEEDKSKIFDEQAEEIIDILLQEQLQGEKEALKVMLEQALSPDGRFVGKESLLQKLDEYINQKEQGLMPSRSSLFGLASSLKTLYENDFKSLDLSA